MKKLTKKYVQDLNTKYDMDGRVVDLVQIDDSLAYVIEISKNHVIWKTYYERVNDVWIYKECKLIG